MRVAGSSFLGSLADQLNQLQAQQYHLQSQIASGLRVQAPEDDPAAMQTALNLEAEGDRVTQYSQTISTLLDKATASYSSISSLKTISDRAQEIATQADGTNSPTDLKTFATEVTQLIKTAVQEMNSQSNGQYLFGGTASGQPPFVMTTDASGNVTSVTYQGNTGAAQNEIAEQTTVSADMVGANTSGSGPRGLITDSRSGADFFNHLISLQNDLQSGDTNAVTNTDLPALGQDSDNIIYQIADNGALQTQLNTAASQAQSRTQSLQKSISNVSGVDMAQTLTQLSEAQNAYQAAIQSSVGVLQMQGTLLNYL